MNRAWRWIGIITLAIGVAGGSAARAEEGLIGGAEAAAAIPTSSLRDRADSGGMASLFMGYMFNDYLGAVGHAEYTGLFAVDRPHHIDDGPQILSFRAGPRLALPFHIGTLPSEVYATWQAGVVIGLVGDTPVSRTSWGYSTGAGLNFRLNQSFLAGVFGRYNWIDQRVEPGNNVQYVTVGVSLTYNAESAPPPVPVVVPAPPPPAPRPVKKKIVLRGVHFDFNKATIRGDARAILDSAIDTLREEGDVAVIVEGHTDDRGSDAYNLRLSERRAQAVRDYLVAGGIVPSRITSIGRGESQPVASNATEDGRAQNRRVEIRIREAD